MGPLAVLHVALLASGRARWKALVRYGTLRMQGVVRGGAPGFKGPPCSGGVASSTSRVAVQEADGRPGSAAVARAKGVGLDLPQVAEGAWGDAGRMSATKKT